MSFNNKKWLAVLMTAGTVLAGCSGGGSNEAAGSENRESVTKACTAELMGMTATISMTAPSAQDEISEIQMDIDMPASYFNLENFDELDDQVKDMIISELSEQLDIPESDIEATTTSDNLKVVIALHSDNMREILGLENNASLVLNDMVKELEDSEEAVCN